MSVPGGPPGRVTLGALLLGSGPRFARDALGPVLAFYAGWKLVGLVTGVATATLVAVAAFVWQRRNAGSGIMPAVGLGIAGVQAAAGLATGSASAFFAPGVVAGGLYGGAFVVSVALGRPLAGVFAREVYPFPRPVQESALFRRTFAIVSLVWGSYMLLRSAVRLAVLSWSSVDLFVGVSVVTGVPITLMLMSWSFWYPLRQFRRQPELWMAGEPPA